MSFSLLTACNGMYMSFARLTWRAEPDIRAVFGVDIEAGGVGCADQRLIEAVHHMPVV